MLVYRNDARERDANDLLRELAQSGRAVSSGCAEHALDALLRAGEIECALADAGHPAESTAAVATDAAAARLFDDGEPSRVEAAAEQLRVRELPARLTVKRPEGYAYYALHPLAYATPARAAAIASRTVAVLGVRSIGTSLGATVCAALRRDGRTAERISVRPGGHAFGRTLRMSERERAFVDRLRRADSLFLVVDEGPGLSGSTLLAVAEALEHAGVGRSRIALLCSHAPDPLRLVAADAAARFAHYACHCATPPHARDGMDLSAGRWRRAVYGADSASWPLSRGWLERSKWWNAEEGWLDKFEGFGPYGAAPMSRARTLADSGFGTHVSAVDGGYARYDWLAGRPARRSDLDHTSIDQLARYCAFRASAFAVAPSLVDGAALAQMARLNVGEAFARDVRIDDELPLRSPVVPDARMAPHEWRWGPHGLIKIDGHADGDGHLLPGPCDICWDIAGAIVEWNMDRAAQDALVARFAQLSGDDVAQRLSPYLMAYCALRVGELTMSEPGTEPVEAGRTQRELWRYGSRIRQLLA